MIYSSMVNNISNTNLLSRIWYYEWFFAHLMSSGLKIFVFLLSLIFQSNNAFTFITWVFIFLFFVKELDIISQLQVVFSIFTHTIGVSWTCIPLNTYPTVISYFTYNTTLTRRRTILASKKYKTNIVLVK